MLGFFQCRVIRKCPTLWFLDSEYVIVKSSSVLVKTLLSKITLQNVFCYYIDDNKEFVIMKFTNAYLTMKDLIRRKHKDFLYNNFKEEYYNMKEKVLPVKHIVDIAENAMKKLGIKPIIKPIRGGTDGCQLSYKGLPCPNIFAGGHNFHGKYEYVPVESMQKAVEVIVKIAELNALDLSKGGKAKTK